jgi:PelA/Pel-15E family pectate lyase
MKKAGVAGRSLQRCTPTQGDIMGYRRKTFSATTTLVILAALSLFVAQSVSAEEIEEVAAAKAREWQPINTGPLHSGIHHAVMKFKGQKAPYPQYTPTQIIHIAETLLAYQNADGGWPANVDWTRTFSEEELATLPHGQEGETGKKSTLDNDNTWSQIGYLAQVYRQSRLKRYADSALKGMDYLLREQRSSGGWRGSDVEAITFNDNVMAGVLRTLKAVAEDPDRYEFVDEERRVNANRAYAQGIQCILDCQIKLDGRLTAWCEQHDHDTLAPVWARTFEPPSITADESVGVVRLLMDIPNPSSEVVAAIQSAVAWFEKVKIGGLRIEKVPADPMTYPGHYSDSDCVEVRDPGAPPIWARYYDLENEMPIFCNRERKITRKYEELNRERRTGMPWYGYWPATLLEKEYPEWQKKCATVPLQTTGKRTLFTITDGEACELATSGRWRLSGTLEVRFEGRIEPHENTVAPVFARSVEAIEGRFDQVQLPEGWLCDVDYDHKTPAVVLRHFRPNRAPAFPGAEGFGKYTIGGRGGTVYEVTNLNDKGSGSFRAACQAEGPRTVVFRVSGTIALESELKVRNPYLTIAGQTAPGDGICIKNYQFNLDTQHVIIRYMHFRPGDEKGKEQDGFGGKGDHLVIDHCSVSWGIDETFSINKGANLTVQWCLVSESLTKSLHKKGSHGYGGLWGGSGGSWHHNGLAHHSSRNPRASGNAESGLLDYRNNVVYNWGFNSAYGGELWPRNWINNYYKFGPATSEKVRHRIFQQKDPRGKMYCAGNYVRGFPTISRNNWAGGIDYAEDGEATEQTLRVNDPYVVAPVRTQSATKAYKLVLKSVGCSLKRDAVDTRVIEEIRTGTAQYGETYGGGGKGLIDSQTAVGGWPELRSLPAPEDSDHDGMPDAWELEHGLNTNDPADGGQDANGDGYTNLEDYLNSLVPRTRTH